MTANQFDRAQALNAKANRLIEQLRTLEPWQWTQRLALLGEYMACLQEALEVLNDI